jgi:hypothetical protein
MNGCKKVLSATSVFVIASILPQPAVFAALSGGGQPLVQVSTTVDRKEITIGDRLKYTVTVERDPKAKVDPFPLGGNLGTFEVKDFKPLPEKKVKGRVVQTTEFVVTTFTTGNYVIPPIAVSYTDTTGKKQVLYSDSIKITVKSVGRKASDTDDIRDIKPPLDVGSETLPFVIGGVLFLLLAAAGYLWWRNKRKVAISGPLPAADTRPVWEIAKEKLLTLKNRDLLQENRTKEYHFQLSEIVRWYLERRFGILALEQTTEEIRMALKKIDFPRRLFSTTNGLLDFCDLVKFAKYQPPFNEIEANWQMAFQLVEETSPKPESAPPAEVGT